MISQIEKCCDELENMIQLRATEEKPNEEDMSKKFDELKILLANLEVEDEKNFGHFKFLFHYYNALYLKMEGKDKEAEIQEKFAKRFEKFKRNNLQKEEQKIEPQDSFLVDDIQTIENNLKSLKEILDETKFAKIEELLKSIKAVPTTFEGLEEIIALKAFFDALTDELSLRLNEDRSSEEMEDLGPIKQSIGDLKDFLDEKVYSLKIEFMNFVLDHSDPKSVIFSNVFKTTERINQRFRLFSRIFHPDKTSWIQGKHQSLGIELFKLIVDQKQQLLKELEKENEVNPYEEKGNSYWNIALDYKRAHKGELDQLRSLRREDISNITPEELKSFSITFGWLVYENYRAACKAADAEHHLEKQIQLRGKMALCLYFVDCWLEAQTYAIAALKIILRNSNKVKLETLIETQKIFQKVKGDSGQPNAKSNQSSEFEKNFALVQIDKSSKLLTVGMAYSFDEKKKLIESIDEELSLIENEMITRPERRVVNCQTSKKAILRAVQLSKTIKVARPALNGVILGVQMILTATLRVSVPLTVAFAGIQFFNDLYTFYTLRKSPKEPLIRENLNFIIENAIFNYDHGKYNEFIEGLSQKYAEDKSLIELKQDQMFENEIIISIDFDNLIKSLLDHDFRPDGIGYLLNLIGEVLISQKLKIGKEPELRSLAHEAFKNVSNNMLKKKAKDLDDTLSKKKISNKKKIIKLGIYLRLIFLGKYIDDDLITEDYLIDAQEMPFQSRLEEMINISLLNLAIISIRQNYKSENIAEELVKRIRESVEKNFQYISPLTARLEALEDFLWIIKGEDVNQDSPSNHCRKH